MREQPVGVRLYRLEAELALELRAEQLVGLLGYDGSRPLSRQGIICAR